MRITSVRFRLLVWNIGILTLILFGFLAIVHTTVRTYAMSAMDQRLKGATDRTALNLISHFGSRSRRPRDRNERPRTERVPDGVRRERMYRIFDVHGKRIGLGGPFGGAEAKPWSTDSLTSALGGKSVYAMATSEGVHIRLYSRPVDRNGQRIAVIQSAMPLTEVEVLLQNLTVTLTLLIPVALIIAALTGLFMTHRALGPVRQIVDTASSLNTDDLSRRLPELGTDEFAHLAKTINGLLSRLEETFVQLKNAVERERRFTADASHELRTPLTAIKLNATLTLKGERSPEQYKEALESIDQSTETMSRLVQDLLLLARSDSHQLPMKFESISPEALCYEAASLARHQATDAPLKIVVPQTIGKILGDAAHLNRLLTNLLENAFRHTPTDGSVTLQAREEDRKIILSVVDTGTGISDEHLPHLGERFYRIDEARTRSTGGTGLGLAICKSIVDAHQGTMSIQSVLGKGTTVSIALDRAT